MESQHPLKIEREAQGWSQIKMAEALGVSARTVGRWESRLAVPHPHYREQLSLLFGKTIEELGLLSDIDENDEAQEILSPVDDPLVPDILLQDLLQADPATSEASIVQQWLTNSLASNQQAHEGDTQTHEQNSQAYEQDTQAHEDHISLHRIAWDRIPPMRRKDAFRTFSRHSMFISSMILLTALVIIAVPLAFNKLSLPKGKQKHASSSSTSTKEQEHFSTPLMCE